MEAFNAFYYSFSPTVARALAPNPTLRAATRAMVYPLITSLRLASSASQLIPASLETSIVLTGVLASILIGLIYVAPILVVIQLIGRRKMR
jgi:hypothetical protein